MLDLSWKLHFPGFAIQVTSTLIIEHTFRTQDGEWEKIRTGMDDILDTIKNTSSSPEFCDLLSERGPCHGSWSRYSFNASTNACQKFTYGGCEGNDNKFYSKTACEEACAKPKKTEGGKMLQARSLKLSIILINKKLFLRATSARTTYIWISTATDSRKELTCPLMTFWRIQASAK